MLVRSRRGRRAALRAHAPLALLALAVVVAGAAGTWAVIAATGGSSAPAEVHRYHSRPDLEPDALTVTKPARGTAPGLVFLAVKRGPGEDGPMIVDNRGHVVWFRAVPQGMTATGFRVQRYRGQPVLTWWQGHTHNGHGMGEYVILDRHYREIARVRAGNGHRADHHEFQLTSRGTAYISAYVPRPADLSAVGGARDGMIYDSLIQEVDVASGHVVWEWRSSDHFPVTEGETPPRSDRPHDYFHVNAVDVDRDGNLLVSARNMHAIYKIDRRSGDVIWRLGGKRSDFKLGPGAHFAFQHDVQRRDDGTISLFDNEATPPQAPQSRGLVLRLDSRRRTATLVRSYTHPERLLAGAEGNLQTLPDGHLFISWGPQRHLSEFNRRGRLLFDLEVPLHADSYQAFRFPWRGEPVDRPVVVARRGVGGGGGGGDRDEIDGDNRADGSVTVWASWNGATEVRRWQLLNGDAADALTPTGEPVARRDFETALRVRGDARWVAVQALDADGHVLGTSRVVAAD